MSSDNHTMYTNRILTRAWRMGFDLAAIVPAAPARTMEVYRIWLADGCQGEMGYLARSDAVAKREDLARIMPGVRSVLAVGVNYHTGPLPPELRDDPSRGVVASYAWGVDYHDVLLPRLQELADFIQVETGQAVAYRAYVDTGPLLEREIGARAGLGFIGKNTNLIQPNLGSWLFLGELLLATDLRPVADSPVLLGEKQSVAALAEQEKGTCGRCTRCLDACPTHAFTGPYVLDARRCISYLTIELKGPIPRELRPRMGNRIFGCDICQEVCPWNRRFAKPTAEPAFQARSGAMAPSLLDLIGLDAEAFGRRFQHSPVKRSRRRGLLRNVAIALGNWGDPVAVPPLARAMHDAEPLIRGHAAWALGRIGVQEARRALAQALEVETDAWVREELHFAVS
jgi:epoxyqueuosine reductase